jgi:cell division protein FtsB|tara:strand:- start:470 stop:673 length:204 start_codon:yes stop_codon:yes gene_type:complete
MDMITEAILGIVMIGLMAFFVYGLFLLEQDKQARWDRRKEKKMREEEAVVQEEAVVRLKEIIKELED